MVNGLVEAMLKGQGRDELGKMLTFLARYVVPHFGAEERLMARYRYPGAALHRRQHADFVEAFTQVKAEFDEQGPTPRLSIAVNQFVCSWLREHVAGSDTELGRFLMSTGAREALR